MLHVIVHRIKNLFIMTYKFLGVSHYPDPHKLKITCIAMFYFMVWQRLQRQLQNQESVTNLPGRLSIQSSAWRTGVLLQNVGAFLLELGRTIMTVRMGQMPVGTFWFSFNYLVN